MAGGRLCRPHRKLNSESHMNWPKFLDENVTGFNVKFFHCRGFNLERRLPRNSLITVLTNVASNIKNNCSHSCYSLYTCLPIMVIRPDFHGDPNDTPLCTKIARRQG